MSNYIPTIGIEVHVELNTKTKIFSNSTNGYGMSANTLVNEIDLGYPGTLPLLNQEVLNIGIKACHVLHCKIRHEMHFDRKNYFYPDNPKNYQITQSRTPIGYDGYVEVDVDGVKKKIEIEEIHIEEDTCKSAHRKNVTLLDFNRAGVPLLEIVTKPCMTSGIEAMKYIEKLREVLLYASISDCKIEEGSMRCDCNVSIRKNKNDPFGTKVEVKNIGSISSVGVSVDREIERQAALYDKGESFKEQTRRFDSKLNDTVLMRVKETGNDYRYFPEPDIPYIHLTDSYIENVLSSISMLPDERREKYKQLGMSTVNIEKIISNKSLSDFLNSFLTSNIDMQIASNLLLGDISSYLNKTNKSICETKLTYDKFIDLVQKSSDRELTSKNIKEMLVDILESDKDIVTLMKEAGISNITDEKEVLLLILKVIENNGESVSSYLEGHDRAFKYLMGQVMKESGGKIDPLVASTILKRELDKK